jgi:hypothetical protein
VAAPAQPAAPPAPSASAARPATGAASAGGQRLVVRALEPTWIRVQTDSGRVAEELLPAGASREWAAERRFLLTIGNAGGVELTLNGKALPSLGPKGTVIQRLELPAPDANPS